MLKLKGNLDMFNEIMEHHAEHRRKLVTAYDQSKDVGLAPSHLKYRPLSKNDFERIFEIIDTVQPILNYDHLSGGCLYVHTQLKEIFARHGYLSEIIFGDVIVNGNAHMGCDLAELQRQLHIGPDSSVQKVHCWLMLENYQFFDATLFRDLSDGVYAAELYGYGMTKLDGYVFHYEPILAGCDFIEKTKLVG